MNEQNSNETNDQIAPAGATESVAQPAAEAAPTAEIPVDPTAEMPGVAYDGAATEADEPAAAEAAGTAAPATAAACREPWYRKIIQSGGATAAVAAGALVVVGLVSGLSACAGAQLGSADDHRDRREMAQRIMEDRGQNFSPDAEDGERGSGNENAMPDGRGYGFDLDDEDGFSNGRGYQFENEGDDDSSDSYGYGRDHSHGYGYDRGRGNSDERNFATPENGGEDQSNDSQRSDKGNPSNGEDQSGSADGGDQAQDGNSADGNADNQDNRPNRNDQQRPGDRSNNQQSASFQTPGIEAIA